MWTRALPGLAFAGLFCLAAGSAALAQGGTCRSADDESARIVAAVKLMMTSADPRWIAARQAYQLPVVSDTSAITLVTADSVCSLAASALNSVLPADIQRTRSVYVIQAGDHYVVEDDSNDTKGGEFQLVITLSSSFAVLARIAS